MTFAGFIGARKEFGWVAFGDGGDEGGHEAEVATAVSAEDAAVVFDSGVDGGLLVSEEVEEGDGVAVGVDGATSSEDAGQSARVRVEGSHGHGDCASVGEEHVDDLVIDDIVVARIDTASVWAFAQGFQDGFTRDILREDVYGPACMPLVEAVAQIDFDG